MSSDTPRTNAHVKRMIDNGQSPEGLEYWARDLERELNAASERIKRLEQAGNDIFLLAQKHAPEYWLYTQTAFNNWHKAKEAKP